MQKTFFKVLSFFVLLNILGGHNAFSQKKKAPAKKTTGSSANPFGGGGASTPTSNSNPFGGSTSTSQPPASNSKQTGAAAKPADPFGSSSSNANPFGGSSSNSGGAANSQPPAKKALNGNLPITILKSSGGNPLTDSVIVPLRNASAVVSNIKDRNPIAYDDIREDDAIYRHKLWKIIDAREKINSPFVYNEDGGNQLFFALLFKAITEDSIVAFEHYDFRAPYKVDKFLAKFSGGMDTVPQYNLDGDVVGYAVGKKEFPIDSVYEFQIMEEIVFDKEASRLVHRIIGIAPMGPLILPTGQVVPGPHFPYFWVYYPDLRKTLAKKQVYNPKNLGARMTWEDYLENQHFSYYIVKSSMDNVKDINLKEYIPDSKFRLFEGEKIKDKIFNYEQGLWSY